MGDPIIEAIGRCDPDEALAPNDPRWYDFDPVRGTNLRTSISRLLQGADSEKKYSHIALAGHRGCGKSTELNRIKAEALAQGYLPLYALVNERYESSRSLIVTTNKNEAELEEQIGERVVSRLVETCELVPVFGDDARWRGSASGELSGSLGPSAGPGLGPLDH